MRSYFKKETGNNLNWNLFKNEKSAGIQIDGVRQYKDPFKPFKATVATAQTQYQRFTI